MSDYNLQDDLYIYKNRLCRLYLPPIIIDNEVIFWIEYIDDGDVSAASEKDVRKANRFEKALFGKKIKKRN